MKRLILLPLALATVFAWADSLPGETEAQRKPSIITKGDCLIRGGRILTVSHGTIEDGSILIQHGKITAIGKDVKAPVGITVIDARGKVIMPGIVDAHSHRGIDATNEGTDSITPECRIQDVFNPGAKNIWQALASGETSGLVLHGSANAVGGQSLVVKFKYNRPMSEIPIPDAPRVIKFALGENVTRSGSPTPNRFPRTRMGVEATYRRAFEDARTYMAKWDAYNKNPNGTPPRRDLRLETLADILRGKIWVQCHSYRADEMLMMVRLSQEFHYKLTLQHALEAYKIAPELAEAGIGVSTFEDDWSFKVEGYDAIPYNVWLLNRAGVTTSINTDSLAGTVALNIDAAKTMRYGGLSENDALKTITINAAKEIGIDHRVGTLDVGKDGDIAIWDGHPLSVYSKCVMAIIEGEVYFQRRDAFGLDAASTTKAVLDVHNTHPALTLPKESRTYAIVGATIHPVSGPVIEDGTVVLQDGKIIQVGKSVNIPAGATRIDAKGLHVYPGFIDAGTTIGLSEIGPIRQTVDSTELGDYQPDLVALTAVQASSEHIPVARCNGITSVITRPAGGVISGRASVMNLSGWTGELMGLKSPAALCINFPGGSNFGGFDPGLFDDEDDIMQSFGAGPVHFLPPVDEFGGGRLGLGQDGSSGIDELSGYFDKALKYRQDRRGNPGMGKDLQMEAMLPYLSGDEPVILRVRSAASIRSAVQFARKYKLKVILSGAPDAWKEAKLLADSNIPVLITPAGKSTLAANVPVSDYDPYDTPYAQPALLKRAGVKFCFQTEDNAMSMTLPFRVAESCAYGLSPEDALRGLTLSAAEILGVADKVGSIDPGKLGNLVISDGDPFEPTSTICYVFINGQPVPLESKFTRLRDKYLQRLK